MAGPDRHVPPAEMYGFPCTLNSISATHHAGSDPRCGEVDVGVRGSGAEKNGGIGHLQKERFDIYAGFIRSLFYGWITVLRV